MKVRIYQTLVTRTILEVKNNKDGQAYVKCVLCKDGSKVFLSAVGIGNLDYFGQCEKCHNRSYFEVVK